MTQSCLGGFPGGSDGKESACLAADLSSIPESGRSPRGGDMATHSSILAWRIPWTQEPGGHSSQGHKELDTTEQLIQGHLGSWSREREQDI